VALGGDMKKAISVVASIAALIATPAIAADVTLPVKAPPVAPAPAVSGWTGFYLGADAGLSATDAKWTATNFVQQLLVAGVPIGTTTGLNPTLVS
jgi:opacity protein-like surface antigen